MDQTLRQVGELLLGSIPTIIFMVLLYGLYNLLVHKPLAKVLAERRSKTEGAVEKARADIAAAEARTAEYEQRLREARLAVFKSQEARRQQALQARARLRPKPAPKPRPRSSRRARPWRKIRSPPRKSCKPRAAGSRPRSFALFCSREARPRREAPDDIDNDSQDHSRRSLLWRRIVRCALATLCLRPGAAQPQPQPEPNPAARLRWASNW